MYAAVFTLPMFTRINNILLAAFLVLSLIDILFFLRPFKIGDIISKGWPVYVFFILAVLATLHDLDWASNKYLEKYWSFLLVPFAMLSDDEMFCRKRNDIFLALIWGSVATLLICYSATIHEIILNRLDANQQFL